MAEPGTEKKLMVVRESFPEVEFLGNYSSVDKFVIGNTTTSCDVEILHLMPDQLLEIDDDGVLLDCFVDRWTLFPLGYRLGNKLKVT